MFEKALVCGIYALAPIHAGSGIEINSPVDLPIQREKHTQFPVIQGQSLKGVLRRKYYYETCKNKNNAKERTEAIFGPETDRADEHAGAVSVCDAKILLFPVRSLKGVFAYVTCPIILERLKRDLEIAKISNEIPNFEVKEDEAVVSSNSELVVDNSVVLEDVILKAREQDLNKFIEVINKILPSNINIKNRIAIVNNDTFKQFVTMATEIVARIRIDQEKGTVATGALWYEEYLPSDTLLYSLILVGNPRKEIDGISSYRDILNELSAFDGVVVQIGGNETIGKGFSKLKVMNNEND